MVVVEGQEQPALFHPWQFTSDFHMDFISLVLILIVIKNPYPHAQSTVGGP